MFVRPRLRVDRGLLASSAAQACSGALVSGPLGLDHTWSRVGKKSTKYRAVIPRVLACTCGDHCIHGRLVEARYSDQSMDGVNKSLRQGLAYLMTDEPIRAGDRRGWTVQNIQAPNFRTLLDGSRTNTDPTRCRAR